MTVDSSEVTSVLCVFVLVHWIKLYCNEIHRILPNALALIHDSTIETLSEIPDDQIEEDVFSHFFFLSF